MFWVICAAMVVLVAGVIALPLLRAPRAAAPNAAYDLGVYRDQLREVDRDLARGVMSTEEAERLRTEIGRKVLDADRAMGHAPAAAAAPRRAVAAVLLVATLAGSVAVYVAMLGSPQMPDAPLSLRFAQADARHKARPSQAEAEAKAPALSVPKPDPQFVALIDQLRKAVAGRPNDEQGLTLLARYEAELGHLGPAREAQAKLIAVKGSRASATDHVTLAFLMIEAAGGLITAEAEAEIARALQLDPENGQARYLEGLLYAQNDRPDLTFPIWVRLLERGPENAPWIAPIRGAIRDLAWIAGHPEYEPPAPDAAGATRPAASAPAGGPAGGPNANTPAPGLAGPSADDVAAAQQMTPEARQAMIAGMVERLKTRLTTEGGTAQEWAQLVRSTAMMGDKDGARAALDMARGKISDRAGLAALDAAAGDAGLE